MRTFALICIILCVTSQSIAVKKKVVCSWTPTSAQGINQERFLITYLDKAVEYCTHFIYPGIRNYATGLLINDTMQDNNRFVKYLCEILYRISEKAQKYLEKFSEFRNKNPDIKLLLGLGGPDQGKDVFHNLATQSSGMNYYFQYVKEKVDEYGLDGIDFDWQNRAYNVSWIDDDRVYFINYLRGFRNKFGSGKIISISVDARPEDVQKFHNVPEIVPLVDIINLKTYDLRGTSGDYNETAFHTPLHPRSSQTSPQSEWNVEKIVEYWIDEAGDSGIDEKLFVGVSTYGRSFTLEDGSVSTIGSPASGVGRGGKVLPDDSDFYGQLAYREICQAIRDEISVSTWDREQNSHYAVFDTDQWVGYDGIRSSVGKIVYSRDLPAIGGVHYPKLEFEDWNNTCADNYYPLLHYAHDILVLENDPPDFADPPATGPTEPPATTTETTTTTTSLPGGEPTVAPTTDTPTTPPDTDTPTPPTDTEIPTTPPTDTDAPTTPIDTEPPTTPSDTETPPIDTDTPTPPSTNPSTDLPTPSITPTLYPPSPTEDQTTTSSIIRPTPSITPDFNSTTTSDPTISGNTDPTGPTNTEPTDTDTSGPTNTDPTDPTVDQTTTSSIIHPTPSITPDLNSTTTTSGPTIPANTDPTGPSVTDPPGPTNTEPTDTDPTGPSITDPPGPTNTEPTDTDPTGPSITDPPGPTNTEPTETDPTVSTNTYPTGPINTDPTPNESTPSTPPNFDHLCNGDGNIPHPYECTKFIICSNGIAYVFICPNNLYYDPTKDQCVYPSESTCVSSPQPDEIPTLPSVTDDRSNGLGFVCPPDVARNFAHPSDCTKFISCVWGYMYIRDCIDPSLGIILHYDELRDMCMWPWETYCPVGLTTVTGPTTVSSTASTTVSLTASTTTPLITTTTTSNSPTLPVDFYCPPDVARNFAHPTDCTRFISCVWGYMYIRDCIDPSLGIILHYDELRDMCMWPWETYCPVGLTTATGPTTVSSTASTTVSTTASSTVSPTTPLITTTTTSNSPTLPVDFYCPPDVARNFAHPTDCTKFISCVWGYMYIMDCIDPSLGIELHYDEGQDMCMWPWETYCVVSGTTLPGQTITTQSTTTSDNTTPPLDFECEIGNDGNFPHPTDCTLFIMCSNGYRYVMTCINSANEVILYYDPRRDQCIFPWQSSCTMP